jgi:regulator of protease activity HflC (stomatin/prohibitin superfamily)
MSYSRQILNNNHDYERLIFKKYLKYVIYFIIILITLITIRSFITRVPPGHVGVVVNLLGDSKGVESEERAVGIHFIPWTKDIYLFPIFEQNHSWQGFTLQTSEGLGMSADVGITFHLEPSKVPVLFQRYRTGMDEITNVFIVNYIRDAINKTASNMKIEELYGSEKNNFLLRVENLVKQDLAPLGINVHRVYLRGQLNFPQSIVTALNSKIEANQRAEQRENELREAHADAKKSIAKAEGEAKAILVKAEAQAKANHIISKSLTHELLGLKAIEAWKGDLPKVIGGSVLTDLK